ncbi:hypothetical protein JCM19235_1928 [Vibrio maritimus]|uniref:YopX protein domain-containing protein n=1 Tax=Vibrio maritimus TaxID=990268 RepID=A0A090RSZ5_9VIBR|nr:hypothetical protein JCM19235_1928 [Vibrio maritimus]
MRPIKVRGYSSKLEKWVYAGFPAVQSTKDSLTLKTFFMNAEYGEWDVMQEGTPFMDKDGVDIYQGDIVEFENGDRTIVSFCQATGNFQAFCTSLAACHDQIKVVDNVFSPE